MRTHLIMLTVSAVLLFSCKKKNDEPVDVLGANWQKIQVHDAFLNDIEFNNNGIGYVVADNAAYRSSNWGLSWNKFNFISGSLNCAITADDILFGIGQSTIGRTTNGGISFSTTETPAMTNRLYDIFFINNTTGFAIDRGGIFQTSNAGLSWTKVSPSTGFAPPANVYLSCYFVNANNGFITIGNGIIRTNTSINNWTASTINPSSSKIFSAVFASSSTIVYGINQEGCVYKSTDGGANFNLLKCLKPGLDTFSDIHFVSDLVGYASVDNQIFKTVDGGNNWETVVSLVEDKFAELDFVNANNGFACTTKGFVLRYKL